MPTACIVGSWVQSGTAGDEWEVRESLVIGRDSIGDYLRPEFEHLRDTVRPTLRIGHVRSARQFDHDYFGMSEAESLAMDPQIRVALQGTIYALENAGITLSEARSLQPQVYSSNWIVEYPDLLEGTEQFRVTGNSSSMIVGRVAHMLDTRGASMVVDTGCASGLAASHLARLAIEKGETQMAIVVTTNLTGWKSTASMLKINMLSQSGFSHTFDRDACGFLRAEGFGVLVYASDELARSRGWRLRGALRATHMNSDGATRNITSPCVQAQVQMYDALLSNRDRSTVDCVIAHGTGTKVGDRVELSSINQLFTRPLPVYSCKSLFGHGESTSSLLSVVSAIQCLETGRLPSQLHLSLPREETGDKHLPFIREERPLSTIALSAFSYGGSNVSAVLESPTTPRAAPAAAADRSWSVLLLSAKTETSLQQRLVDMAECLEHSSAPLADILHTANSRRSFYSLRRAVVGRTRHELLRKLRAGDLVTAVTDSAAATPSFRLGDASGLWRYRVLYEGSTVFKRAFDELCEAAKDSSNADTLKKCLFSPFTDDSSTAAPQLLLTLALAKMWQHFNVFPASMTVASKTGLLAALVLTNSVQLEQALEAINDGAKLRSFTLKSTIPLLAEDGTAITSVADFLSCLFSVSNGHLLSFVGVEVEGDCEVRRTEALIARLFVAGVNVSVNVDSGAICDLPLYPFTKTEFWPEPKSLTSPLPISSTLPIVEKIVDVEIETKVRELIRKFAPEIVNDDTVIPELLDSLSAMDLTASLGEPFGLTLPLDTTDKHQTIPDLIAYITKRMSEQPAKVAARVASTVPGAELGILGFDIAAPGADGVEELHDKLMSGRTTTRYDLNDVDLFDAAFFGLSKEEVDFMDPQHRLLLQSSMRSWSQAGCPDLHQADLILAISATSDHRTNVERECQEFDERFWQGTNHSVFSGMAAKVLGVGGRSFVIDTTCTSVYSALEMAVDRLRAGSARYAVILSAKLHLSDNWQESLTSFLSLRRSSPFDSDAEGYVRCECVGSLLVGPVTDGLHPLALIHQVLTKQSGSGLMPSEVALTEIIDPSVDVVISHGTGTLSGDKIEAAAYSAQKEPRTLLSVKGQMGHAEAASGLLHLATAIGHLRAGRVHAHQHVSLLIPQLREADHVTPIIPEERPELNKMGLVSYGVAGVHAFASLKAPKKDDIGSKAVSVVLPLSANSEEALQESIDRLKEMLQTTSVPLCDIARQLQSIDPMKFRVAVTASTHAEAISAISNPLRSPRSLFVAHCMPEDVDVVGFNRGVPIFKKEYVQFLTAIGGNLTSYDIMNSIAGMAALFRLFLHIDTVHTICVTESGVIAVILALDLASVSTIRDLIRAYEKGDTRALLVAARDVDFARAAPYKLVDAAKARVNCPQSLADACVRQGFDEGSDILVGGRGFRGGRKISSMTDLTELIAQQFVNGGEIAWTKIFGERRRFVSLPPYAFMPQRYSRFLQRTNIDVRLKRYAYLADHVIEDGLILPGAWSVAAMMQKKDVDELTHVDFKASAYVDGIFPYHIDYSKSFGGYVTVAQGSEITQGKISTRIIKVKKIPKPVNPSKFSKTELYEKMARNGYTFKPHFRSLASLEVDETGIGRAKVERRVELDVQIDAAFQCILLGYLGYNPDDTDVYLPFYARHIHVEREPLKRGAPLDVRFRLGNTANSISGDILVYMGGELVMAIENFVLMKREKGIVVRPAIEAFEEESGQVVRVMNIRVEEEDQEKEESDDQLKAANRIEQEAAAEMLRDWIKTELKDDDLDEELGFFEMGLQSHQVVMLKNYLRDRFPGISPTAAFDYPTIEVMAEYLTTLEMVEPTEAEAKVLIIQVEEADEEEDERVLSDKFNCIVLQVEELDEELGFLEMGLHSHQLIYMRNFLRALFPDVSPVGAFDHPTIAKMAAYLSTLEWIGSDEDLFGPVVMTIRVAEEPIDAVDVNNRALKIKERLIEILGDLLTSDEPLDVEELEGGFTEMGLDSLGMTDFVNALNGEFDGISLGATDLYDHPTIAELAQLIS
ncbi:hypothetical protein PFISCL1PPCAC_24838, partial [Pristionchus fissidentatus]